MLSICTTAGTLLATELTCAQALFVEEASRRGLNYLVSQGAFSGGQFGCGVCIADLDGDGDDDIVCLGASTERLGFFRNDGTGVFTDVSASTGLGQLTKASGIAAGDYDADGDLDLALTRWVLPPALLRNNGAMQFTNVASAAGIAVTGAGAGVSWADYDGDGWIDLSVANRTATLFNNTRNKLWRNNGNGTFTEMATALGVDNGGWPAFTASWCDLDGDGDMDLYVGNDKGVASPFWNRLYRNRGDGTFFEDLAAGADMQADSMGVGFGDLDGD
ncbi:MAG: FG-GAP repeat domain-containing protein, partial [Planctomycetota bacterium]